MLYYHERLLAFKSNLRWDSDHVILKGSFLYPEEEIIDWETFLNKICVFCVFRAHGNLERSMRSLTLHLAT